MGMGPEAGGAMAGCPSCGGILRPKMTGRTGVGAVEVPSEKSGMRTAPKTVSAGRSVSKEFLWELVNVSRAI